MPRQDAGFDAEWRLETQAKVAEHGARLNNVETRLGDKVSRDSFLPVKLFVYTLMGTLGTGVLGAVLKLLLAAKGG